MGLTTSVIGRACFLKRGLWRAYRGLSGRHIAHFGLVGELILGAHLAQLGPQIFSAGTGGKARESSPKQPADNRLNQEADGLEPPKPLGGRNGTIAGAVS